MTVVVFSNFELDDDKERLDLDAIWSFLTQHAYWARWRARADLERQIAAAWRVVAAYTRDDGALVGFARTTSDGCSVAYLADVFVVPEQRGRGLGTALVATMLDVQAPHLRWILHTSDAHDLYAKFGFVAADQRVLERPPPPP